MCARMDHKPFCNEIGKRKVESHGLMATASSKNGFFYLRAFVPQNNNYGVALDQGTGIIEQQVGDVSGKK